MKQYTRRIEQRAESRQETYVHLVGLSTCVLEPREAFRTRCGLRCAKHVPRPHSCYWSPLLPLLCLLPLASFASLASLAATTSFASLDSVVW
jgi:hypothetical protein